MIRDWSISLKTFYPGRFFKEAAAKVNDQGIAVPLTGIIIKGNKACIEHAAWEVRKEVVW